MPTEEPVEKDVQEVRCSETGVPLPAIPAWYANVQVKFISDAVRQKSARVLEAPATEAVLPARPALPKADVEPILEDAEIEADAAEDLEVEIEDTDVLETEDE